MQKQKPTPVVPWKKYWLSLSMDERERLAKKLDTKPAYLYQIGTGNRKGSPKFIKKLEKEINGAVKKEVFRPDIFA